MDEPVELLREIVSIPSVTGNTGEAVEYLRDKAEGSGMDAVIDRGALIINPDAGDLILLGHIDTVPGDLEIRMDRENRLWGRGTVDAKGPLCSAFSALCRREDLFSKVKLIAVPDEEGDSKTAGWIRDEMEPTPVVVLEPSGASGITISYRGRMLIETEARSSPSHSGGEIPFATEILLDRLGKVRENTGGRILRMKGDMERATCLIDIRYLEEPDLRGNDEMMGTRILENIPPVEVDRNNPLVRGFLRGIRSGGMRPVFKRKTGTCDMNIIGEKWDVPLMAYGPGDGKLDHTDREHIDIREYLRSIDVWTGFLDHFFKP